MLSNATVSKLRLKKEVVFCTYLSKVARIT